MVHTGTSSTVKNIYRNARIVTDKYHEYSYTFRVKYVVQSCIFKITVTEVQAK